MLNWITLKQTTYSIYIMGAGDSDRERDLLRTATDWFMARSLAANTARCYATHATSFVAFCLFFMLQPMLPVTDCALAQYIVFLSMTLKPQSIRVYMAGLRHFHIANGFDWIPVRDRPQAYQAYRGVQRMRGSASASKLAISLELLLTIRSYLDFTSFNDIMWWAAAMTAFYGLLRKDNITVSKPEAYNHRVNLSRADFKIAPGEGTFNTAPAPIVWLRIKQSKTYQFGAREHVLPLHPVHEREEL